MYILMMLLLVLAFSPWRVSCLSDVELVTVARSRVNCAREFVNDAELGTTCTGQHRNAECFMCWEMSEHLVAEPDPWSQLCETVKTNACTDGCKSACRFINEMSPRYNAPERHLWRFPDAAEFNSLSTTKLLVAWKAPETREEALFDGIYLIFWRYGGNIKWNHFQTVQTDWAIFEGEHEGRSQLEFKLLAVSVDGVIAIARLEYPLHESTVVETSNDYFIGDYDDVDDYYDDAPEVNSDTYLEVDIRIKRDVSGHMNVSVSWRSIDTASVYTVQWSRTGCIVEKCPVDTDVFASVLEDETQTYPSLELPRAMFGAVYWVRVTTKQTNGRQVSQQVYFVTPSCDELDHVTTRCANQRFSEERVKTTSSYPIKATVTPHTTESVPSSSVGAIALGVSSVVVCIVIFGVIVFGPKKRTDSLDVV